MCLSGRVSPPTFFAIRLSEKITWKRSKEREGEGERERESEVLRETNFYLFRFHSNISRQTNTNIPYASSTQQNMSCVLILVHAEYNVRELSELSWALSLFLHHLLQVLCPRRRSRPANAKPSIVLDKWYFVCLIMTFFLKVALFMSLTSITLVLFHLRTVCVCRKKRSAKSEIRRREARAKR